MAEEKPVEEFDDEGNPIVKKLEGEGGKTTPPKIKSDEKPEDEESEGEGEEPEVPVRKSVQQHIIARQQKTIEKLRSKQEGEEEDETPLGEEEEITPEAQSLVAKEVKRAVEPIIQTLAGQADEAELQELFETEPDAKGMSKQIRAYMKNPHYAGVPPAVIYHHLAFDKALGGAVKKKANADLEARHHKGAGSTRRPKGGETGNVPSVEEQAAMDEKEFEALQHEARTGKLLES